MKKLVIVMLLALNQFGNCQYIKVKFETLFTLGDKDSATKEYWFVSPTIIKTDNDNNIYIYDKSGCQIKKYDKNGKYLLAIGRGGDGPGEFRQIEAFFINQKNHLVIKDNNLGRYTYLTLDGKYISSENVNLAVRYLNFPSPFGADGIIGLVDVNKGNKEHGNKILVYDKNLKNILTSFGHSSIFWQYRDPHEIKMDLWSDLNYTLLNDEKVYVAKKFYDGKLYIFDRSKSWSVGIAQGITLPYQDYEVVEKRVSDKEWDQYFGAAEIYGQRTNGVNKVITTFYRVKSIGVFLYNNKYILNFLINLTRSKDVEFGIDVYGINGKNLGYYKVDKNKYGTINMSTGVVFCKDNEENFYMKDEINKVPVIRKFKLEIE